MKMELIEAYLLSRSIDDRNRAVEAFLPYASMIAKRFCGKGMEYDELYQTAGMALVWAVERYDPNSEAAFLTYAIATMVGEIKHLFRDYASLVHIPYRTLERMRIITEVCSQYEQEHFKSPTVEEIAAISGFTSDEVSEALTLRVNKSVVSIYDDNIRENLPGDDDLLRNYDENETLRRAVTQLPLEDREFIQLRYYQGLSQQEIAKQRHVSQMTVSRIEKRVLMELKKLLA